MDANVLIDFCDADRTVLKLVSEHVGQIHVPLPIIHDEVEQLDLEDCAELGIVPVEPTLATAASAAQRRAGLSFNDHLCLLLARENGWTCVTNDGCLRRECGTEKIPVLWGLELLAMLVDGRVLQVRAAEELGRAIQRANPSFITDKVMKGFLERIGAATSKRGRPKRR